MTAIPNSRQLAKARSATTRQVSPWWMELISVDLRHAFWPWASYFLLVCTYVYFISFPFQGNQPPIQAFFLFLAIAFSWSAAATAIFTPDYSHGAISSLLTFPRERSGIWLLRCGMAFILLLLPLIISPLLIAFSAQPLNENGAALPIIMQLFHFGFIEFTTCLLVSVILRKALLVWPITVLSPLFLLIAYVLVRDGLGFEWGQYSNPDKFPYQPPAFFWFSMVYGAVAFFVAWRLWLRLEVR